MASHSSTICYSVLLVCLSKVALFAFSSFVRTCSSNLFSLALSTVIPQLTEWGSHCRQGPLHREGGTDCSRARYAPCSVTPHECTSQCGGCAPLSRQLYYYREQWPFCFRSFVQIELRMILSFTTAYENYS